MNILDLDEAQGLTREMVDRYLDRAGWCQLPDPEQRLLKPQYAHVSLKMGMGAAVERIASITGSAPQALLRDINPRMRKGMPSQAARAAHAGPWVGHMGGEFPLVTIGHWGDDGSFTAGLMLWDARKVAEAAEAKYPCAFWPCDEHGAKVRWLEENGAML